MKMTDDQLITYLQNSNALKRFPGAGEKVAELISRYRALKLDLEDYSEI